MSQIIFDFDGVLVDSVNIKNNSFKQLATEFRVDHEDILEHFKTLKRAWTRFDYFGTIVERRGGKVSFNKINGRYRELCFNKILNANRIQNLNSLKEKSESDWALVSATYENELKEICEHFNWTSLFNLGIYGSPNSKKINILKFYDKNAWLLGDTIDDLLIAKEMGIKFCQIKNWSTDEGDFSSSDYICNNLEDFFYEKNLCVRTSR